MSLVYKTCISLIWWKKNFVQDEVCINGFLLTAEKDHVWRIGKTWSLLFRHYMTRFKINVTKLWQAIKNTYFFRYFSLHMQYHFCLWKFNREPKIIVKDANFPSVLAATNDFLWSCDKRTLKFIKNMPRFF